MAGAAGDVVPRVGIQLILVRFLLNHRLVAAAILAVNLFPGHILYCDVWGVQRRPTAQKSFKIRDDVFALGQPPIGVGGLESRTRNRRLSVPRWAHRSGTHQNRAHCCFAWYAASNRLMASVSMVWRSPSLPVMETVQRRMAKSLTGRLTGRLLQYFLHPMNYRVPTATLG